MLPATYTVPLFWPPDAISALKYPTFQQRLLKLAKFVQSFAGDKLDSGSAREAFSGLSVGADAFGWALAAASSRAARLQGGQRGLVPIIDIGNHAYKGAANCEVRGTLGGTIELVALREIALGEEVTYCCAVAPASIQQPSVERMGRVLLLSLCC